MSATMAAEGHKTNGATQFHPRMLINGKVCTEIKHLECNLPIDNFSC
jgi:hypothetical protein